MNDTIIRELSEERDELAAASKQAPDHYNTCEWGWHNYGAANPNVCTCGWPAIRDAALAPHKPACQKCHGTRETRERLPYPDETSVIVSGCPDCASGERR